MPYGAVDDAVASRSRSSRGSHSSRGSRSSHGTVDDAKAAVASARKTQPFSNEFFPTKWVDLVSLVPCVIFSIGERMREGPLLPFTWQKRHYMKLLLSETETWDGPDQGVFIFYTFDVLLTLSVVVYHLVVSAHPKYYVTRGNKCSIVSHIIGGTAGILGLYIGLLTGQPIVIVGSIVLASLLHLPTVYWQLRMVHGHREVIIPAYVFIAFGLANCYMHALTRNLHFRYVVQCGMCLHIFSWCRLALWMSDAMGMSGEDVYDRMVIFAGIVHLPFVAGHWAGLFFILYIFWWNFLFNIFKPFPRELLSVNRGFHDVFNDSFENADGKLFTELYDEYKKSGMDHVKAVVHASYDMLRKGESEVEVEDLARLIESWGVPRSDIVARELFVEADVNKDGKISFEEFESKLWFIWTSIKDSGEMDTRAQLKAVSNRAQDPPRGLEP